MSADTATQPRPYVCPACEAEHRTLHGLLTCHPRELRLVTDWLVAKKPSVLSLRSVIGGHMVPATRRAVWLVLHPATASEEAAA